MAVETSYTPENPVKRFTEALVKLSDPENPQPLNPTDIDPDSVRGALQANSIPVESIRSQPELMKAITDSQFRGPNQGKGPAVVEALGGLENYQKVFQWAMEMSQDQPLLSKGDETSRSRGLMQFIGETIAMAAGAITPEEFCQKTNLRVGKKYKDNTEIAQKFKLPTDDDGIKKMKETSSVPKGSAIKAWERLLSLNQ